ncbi:MAG TPA: hypothetical protein VL068_08480, partial [Microthrixaceae bacterium]|nr:hypothetical protein [Microthrixaceae bacterium]
MNDRERSGAHSESGPTPQLLTGRRSFLMVVGSSAVLAACTSGSDADGPSGTDDTQNESTAGKVGDGSGDSAAGDSAAEGIDAAGMTPNTPFIAADFASLGTCSLLPEMTAGPFPLDRQLDRRDVTEGLPGMPLRLGLRVLDESCKAVPSAVVEIWHADVSGDYSAFTDGGGGKDEAGDTTFMRGSQTADADGIVEFMTIVPGWYTGRAVHIHLRVHLGDRISATSQLFFKAEQLEKVYSSAPYVVSGRPNS